MFFHACARAALFRESTILYLRVRNERQPRMFARARGHFDRGGYPFLQGRGTGERDFQRIADRVLAPGETDDPRAGKRTDAALAVTGLILVKAHHVRREAPENEPAIMTSFVDRT